MYTKPGFLACCKGSKPVLESFSDIRCEKRAEGIASFYSIIGKYLSSRIDLTMHIINCVYAKAKKKNMCVSCYIPQKNRVGRSLLFFFFFLNFYFLFSLILPRNTTNVLFA